MMAERMPPAVQAIPITTANNRHNNKWLANRVCPRRFSHSRSKQAASITNMTVSQRAVFRGRTRELASSAKVFTAINPHSSQKSIRAFRVSSASARFGGTSNLSMTDIFAAPIHCAAPEVVREGIVAERRAAPHFQLCHQLNAFHPL